MMRERPRRRPRLTAEAPPAASGASAVARRHPRHLGSQEMVLACAIVLLFGRGRRDQPAFSAPNNLNTIFLGNAYIAVAAIGMSMVIISGNIDISVGALIGVLATISGTLAVSGYPIWVAWLAPAGGRHGGHRADRACSSPICACPRSSSPSACSRSCKGGLISVTGGAWINNLPPATSWPRCGRSASRCRSGSWSC